MLIDCSELELGRNLGQRHGRLDDTIDAYKRRLELYRELTLPMLKTLDEANRLKIVTIVIYFGSFFKKKKPSEHSAPALGGRRF